MTTPNLIPLSPERHGPQRWRRFEDYGFARDRRMVPVVLAEAEPVASAMPLVFAETANGFGPVALLRTQPLGTTPYIGAHGRWQAAYTPSILRVHPFAAAPTEEPGRMVLLVDEASGLLTDDPLAERFFDPFGALSPAVQAVVTFFRQYQLSVQATHAAMHALVDARTPSGDGIFAPLTGFADLTEDQAQGLWMIDRASLDALDDAAWIALRASGALGLAQAHLVSRWNLAFLRRAELALASAALTADAGTAADDVRAGNTAAGPAGGVSDFLAALADARDTAFDAGPLMPSAPGGKP